VNIPEAAPLAHLLSRNYSITASRITQIAPGEMARAYEVIEPEGARWFVKVRPADSCFPLNKDQMDSTLLRTLQLRQDVSRADVVTPLISKEGFLPSNGTVV
jgi:hypothetical protein